MITLINDGQIKSYLTTDFLNLEITTLILGVQDGTPPINLNLVPLVTETDNEFWQRVGIEIANKINLENNSIIPISFSLVPNGLNTDITISPATQQLILSKGFFVVEFNFIGTALSENFEYKLESIDLSILDATSYNNEIARSQDDLPTLV